jgi:hypothetical protein
MLSQGNELFYFETIEKNGVFCCFWLYTRDINQETFFNGTVMVIPRIVGLFEFDERGNCIDKPK